MAKKPAPGNIGKIVHSPNEVAYLTRRAIEGIHDQTGIQLGIPAIDAYLTPGRPGDLITIMGRPGHLKTGLMKFWARCLASEIVKEKADDKECIVFVTWEMATEELGIFDFANIADLPADDISRGKVPIDDMRLTKAAAELMKTPIYVIGHDLKHRRQNARLAMPDIIEALEYIEDTWDLRPRAVFLDYLQRMAPPPGVRERRHQVEENVHLSKDAAFLMGCPVIMGVQASRDVDGRKFKLPQQGDGLESSAIEHAADKMLSLWRPAKTESLGSEIKGWSGLTVTENLLFIGVQKNRFGPAGKAFPCFAEPAKNDFHAMMVHPDGSYGR